MQKKYKISPITLRIIYYTIFFSAIASGYFGIILAGASASGGGGGGGMDLVDGLLKLKDILFIFSAIMAIYFIISPHLENRKNVNLIKKSRTDIIDIFILLVVFLNFS